ncbi:MAG: hypothetical protein IPH11_16395 [Ignavibacteriales bacterium]|nr:hypothetical protein [Ignavibacteriales bacterium]
MFFKKNKVGKGISEAALAVVSDIETAKQCRVLCSNDNSASWLSTEIMIQEVNALEFIIWSEYGQHYEWANIDFFERNITKGILASNHQKELSYVILKGVNRLQSIEGEGEERLYKVYKSSADLVSKYEPDLKQEELINFIQQQVELFIKNCEKYFY